MNRLFTTFSRTALVAFGLAIAPAAMAQTSATCSGAFNTPVDTGNGFACTFSCPAGQTGTINGSSVSCSAGGGGDVAPSGCKLTASPTSGGPAATNVSLTLSCTSGTLPITVAWKNGSAPGNCPSSMDALSKGCTVSGVAANTTWTVDQFSNSVGNGSGNSNKTATFTYTAGGGGGSGPDYSSCPSGTNTYNGLGSYMTNPIGVGGSGWAVVGFTVPSAGTDTAAKKGQFNYPGWYYAISEKACDLSEQVVPMITATGSVTGQALTGYATGVSVNIYYARTKNLTPGKTYYLNLYGPGANPTQGNLPKIN